MTSTHGLKKDSVIIVFLNINRCERHVSESKTFIIKTSVLMYVSLLIRELLFGMLDFLFYYRNKNEKAILKGL